jgi:hypothetical protein
MQLILYYTCDGLLVNKIKLKLMEGDETICRFTAMDMVGVIKQRFVKMEVSAIVDDHPSSKTQVMVYTLHIIEPHINAHLPINIYIYILYVAIYCMYYAIHHKAHIVTDVS